MMSRLGLLGGMFDPVHKAHVGAARFALALLQLDCVKMLPCNTPNHRESSTASAEHRLAMLQLALKGERGIEADPLELERGGVSYSIDTLEHFSGSNSSNQIVFILGVDAMNALPRWHRWQDMFGHCHFLVMGRVREQIDAATEEAIGLARRVVANPLELFEQPSGRIYFAREFDFNGSSSVVRELLAAGEPTGRLLQDDVAAYIEAHGLYRA